MAVKTTAIRPLVRTLTSSAKRCSLPVSCLSHWQHIHQNRTYQTQPIPQVTSSGIPDFAFAFDIDGVLLRSSAPLPGAAKALSYLQKERIPFILLTNGGGRTEAERIADVSRKLDLELDEKLIVQSHTPFSELRDLHEKTVLVVGGERDNCQRVAESYGFKNAVTPGDLVVAYPELWPFNRPFYDYYKTFARKLPTPLYSPTGNPILEAGKSLKIDAVFVYNDPRDWGLDASIILDVLLSQQGYLGTLSERNGKKEFKNAGYLQDGQPHVWFSNPDLWWATSYHLSRLGQGGFQAAFRGLWDEVTGGASLEGQTTVIGKPNPGTYEFAERQLLRARKSMFGAAVGGLRDPLKRVYMIGDNPESDIAGANNYKSPWASEWKSILVKTGVWREGVEPTHKPYVVKENVLDAVQWAVEDAKKELR
ncbi:Putative HAD-superfamily hydrolase, subfamily IIA, HAD superfamily [Septoria linicola]|uniref:HAD-superfamily hydrolase, subfamily IIA, HAD superfamily n=1 Tax=Septoria linicola TaxID=215465 RepID=A0A9Q9AQ97_9PEZI|nr:Putative HAD-superfamily hydrolase, subfamily IIA, HAD superfamily [Septoria linicola]